MISLALGGIGLFILGMSLLTEGLRHVAGDSLRRGLSRFTGGPFRAFLAGVGTTAVMQSSSATIVMTIGFVSAGLISFSSAVAVIIGANLGTTSTGWLVSLLGLKFSVSVVALPLVGIGVGFRILGRGRLVGFGNAIAGFGLVFVGIDTLQAGMSAFADRFTFDGLDDSTVLGILALVGIGVAMTVVMQSSSAAVATTLTALSVGAITLHQAATLVIGQNIGTTVTAAIAAIGASVAARRTAFAHIFFNLGTGVIALIALPHLETIAVWTKELVGADEHAASIAAFHTSFNLIGCIVFLPMLRPYVRFIAKVFPEERNPLIARLDRSVAKVGAVALEAARRTLADIAAVLGKVAIRVVQRANVHDTMRKEMDMALVALEAVRRFMQEIVIDPNSQTEYQRQVSNLHALDHLSELARAISAAPIVPPDFDREHIEGLTEILNALANWPETMHTSSPSEIESVAAHLRERLRGARHAVLADTAIGRKSADETLVLLDFIRWADQVAWHASRVAFYLTQSETDRLHTD